MIAVERYREVPGFEVFDSEEARRLLDERSGPLVRFAGGMLELNGPALELLKDTIGARTGVTHGVLLCFDPEARRVGVVAAPTWCPPGKVQLVDTLQAGRPTMRTPEWPAAVDVRLFVQLYGLGPHAVQDAPRPVRLEDGVLVFPLRGAPVRWPS